jgi:hypothetical protein
VKLDEWITANGPEIDAGDSKKYKAGFHVYAEESRHDKRRRVYVRQVTCEGMQDGERCLIAQQMYVPSDENAWPPKEPSPMKSLLNRVRGKGKP